MDIRTNNIQKITVKNDGKVGVNTTNPRGIFQVGNNQFIVSTNGNVGIGINPTQKLHVNGNILATVSIVTDYVLDTILREKGYKNLSINLLN